MVNGLGLRHRLFAYRLRHEHTVVQVAFVHRPHVHETEHQEDAHGILLLQLAIDDGQQDACTHQNNIERAPAVSRKHSDTHLCQVLHQRCQLVSRNLAQRLHLIVAEEVGEEHFRHQGKKKGYTTCQGKRHQ